MLLSSHTRISFILLSTLSSPLTRYDVEYIRYFAGIEALYLPSYCGYAARAASYEPQFNRPVCASLTNRLHDQTDYLLFCVYDEIPGKCSSFPRTNAQTSPFVSRGRRVVQLFCGRCFWHGTTTIPLSCLPACSNCYDLEVRCIEWCVVVCGRWSRWESGRWAVSGRW